MVEQKNYHVSNWKICTILFNIIFYFVDVGLDVKLAVSYYNNGLMTYFTLTLAAVVIPALFSYTSYLLKNYENYELNWKNAFNYIPFPYVTRNVHALLCAIRSRYAEARNYQDSQEENYNLLKYESSALAIFELFESYVESGLQQILQISLLLNSSQTSGIYLQQCLSISSSFITMAKTMTSYHKYVHNDSVTRKNISLVQNLLYFLWHFNVTVSRILSIAVIASMYPMWTALTVAAHWFEMASWLNRNDFSKDSIFSGILTCYSAGFVLILNYVSDYCKCKYRYYIFYFICFLENLVAVTVWAVLADANTVASRFYVPMIIVPSVTFLLGMIFCVIYNKNYLSDCDYHLINDPLDCPRETTLSLPCQEDNSGSLEAVTRDQLPVAQMIYLCLCECQTMNDWYSRREIESCTECRSFDRHWEPLLTPLASSSFPASTSSSVGVVTTNPLSVGQSVYNFANLI